MLQVIITAALFITGLFATDEHTMQTSFSQTEICSHANWKPQETCFQDKPAFLLWDENTNLKNENERETI
ncbi:hypothetical protein [Flavobacterium sp.]|jgi:hypothetical protein|uniref:hypothetical protein n=1 Tax=Flavobacterium sp. TaxID=239 RepID=UPI0037BEFD77